MKQSPIMDKIQQNMQPGVITLDGFLGNDDRNLIDILEEDDAEVKRLGYTHEAIANRMVELKEAGKKGVRRVHNCRAAFRGSGRQRTGKASLAVRRAGTVFENKYNCSQ